MLVATVDSEELRPYLGLVGTITEVDDAKEKFSLRFERPAGVGGGAINGIFEPVKRATWIYRASLTISFLGYHTPCELCNTRRWIKSR